MTAAKLWRVLRSTWWWIVIGAVTGALLAALALLVLPRTYESTARVMITATPSEAPGTPTDTLSYIGLKMPAFVELVESDPAVESIAAATGSTPKEVDDALTYTVPDERPVIVISAEAGSPEASQQLAAASAAEVITQVEGDRGALPVSATQLAQPRPGSQVFPSPLMVLVAGAMTGALAAFLSALVAGSRDRLPHALPDLAEAAGAPAMGVLGDGNPRLRAEAERTGHPTSAIGLLRRLDASGGRRFVAVPIGEVDTATLAGDLSRARTEVPGPAAVEVTPGEIGADDLARIPADHALVLLASHRATVGTVALAAHRARNHGARIAGVVLAARL